MLPASTVVSASVPVDGPGPAVAPLPMNYPLGDLRPELGHTLTLRAGLHWVRMPLPFALDHINLWVLDDQHEDRPSWTVIDSGVFTDTIQAAWRTLWDGPLAGRDLTRMLVTHMHPDHVGNAQWLIEQFSPPGTPARLWMSAGEYLAAQISCTQTTGYGGERAARYFGEHGLQDPLSLARIRERGDYYATMVPTVPSPYRRLMDGMSLAIGQRQWRCMAGFGHSPEHIALYCEQDGILVAGDMLLPRISTNVSVTDGEPEADALGLFLSSLSRMQALPADTLVLPSHGLPFVGLHDRIQALYQHHADRLEELMAVCRQAPASAAEVLPVLFKRTLDLHQTTFAMGEAVAHLNYLWHRGQVNRQRDAQGVWRFSATP